MPPSKNWIYSPQNMDSCSSGYQQSQCLQGPELYYQLLYPGFPWVVMGLMPLQLSQLMNEIIQYSSFLYPG